jgi:hypothetical protein
MTYLPQTSPRVSFLPPSQLDPREIEEAERRKEEDAKKYRDVTTDSPSAPLDEKFPGQP